MKDSKDTNKREDILKNMMPQDAETTNKGCTPKNKKMGKNRGYDIIPNEGK